MADEKTGVGTEILTEFLIYFYSILQEVRFLSLSFT